MATTHKSYGCVENFRVTKVQHQRNGISGRPFHHIFFSYEERGGSFHPNMLAIMPDNEGVAKPDLCECYVVDLNAPEECWRGDNFFTLSRSPSRRTARQKTSAGTE